MNPQELKEVLDQHKLWLKGKGGRRADLSGADLSGADLCRTNLRGADLSGADLRRAHLWSTIGNNRHIKSLRLEEYDVSYTGEVIQIGCQQHTIEEWRGFDGNKIGSMDGQKALDWWAKWKDFIFQAIELSPAQPTKEK